MSAGFGKAASFDGVAGSYISVPDPEGDTNDIDRTGADMSLSVWMKATSWTKGWQGIVVHGEGQDYRIARSGDGSPTQFAAVAGTTDIVSGSTYGAAPDGDGNWHHIVITAVNGGEAVFYVDGVQEGTSTGLGDPTVSIAPSGNATANTLFIGGNSERENRDFHGLLDDVAIWDRALTPEEVAVIHSEGTSGNALTTLLDQNDNDNDDLPNAWENLFGLDPEDNTGDNGADGDPDMDTISNIDEFNNGTSPILNDTDGDGLFDNEENNSGNFVSATNTGTDPNKKDTDDDFAIDNVEAANMTNPIVPDTDGDGILDGHETKNGFQSYISPTDTGTDPLVADTDLDGFDDNAEIALGTDPTDIGSVPPPSTLPIFDDFEDNSLDVGLWKTVTDTVPQDNKGTNFGGSVSEEGGNIQFANRGYLYTATEFDPALVGGLQISGELTFLTTQDVVSILTRSDATPSDSYGEVTSGVQFSLNANGDNVGITARNGDHTVENAVVDGMIDFQANVVYTFTVIDDGDGALSLVVTDKEAPENTISVSAELTNDISDNNHVVVHNREGNRTSNLHQIEIESFLGSASNEILEISYDSAGDQFTLTWESRAGISYYIYSSPDLIDFSNEVADDLAGEAGSTTFTFDNPEPGLNKLFFLVGPPPAN
ncbi:LamG domain-containing protein [bacterium]|nr:LamG domain-containing protein [bacterium]